MNTKFSAKNQISLFPLSFTASYHYSQSAASLCYDQTDLIFPLAPLAAGRPLDPLRTMQMLTGRSETRRTPRETCSVGVKRGILEQDQGPPVGHQGP